MITKNKKTLLHLFIISLLFFGFRSDAEENQNTIEIKNPIFTTKSIDGNPYEIKAEKGLQRENYLDLFVIEAKLKTNKKSILKLFPEDEAELKKFISNKKIKIKDHNDFLYVIENYKRN